MADLSVRLNSALSGRYRVERELGRGGMAMVFLAEDSRHRRKVAVKVLQPELAAVLGGERFLREIEIAAGLSHPHILPLYDSGAADGLLYYVMPFVEGDSLRQRLARERQLPIADALRIARETADALDYAHRRGVVHRDIKPENILLSEHHAVVADFGIARAVLAAGGQTLTATGTVVGTPAYMSPEQVAGGRELDGRSDQYALGCVLYEMLAGQPPFVGPTAESLAHQHLSILPRAVTELRSAVPATVAVAITRALAKTAADRFASAAEFASALPPGGDSLPASESGSSGVAMPVGTREETRQWPPQARVGPSPRRRRLVAAGVALATIALMLAAWRFREILIPAPAPDPAKRAWILVAEFDGPPGDSLVVAATRDLVIAALEQSKVVAAVPPDQIRVALQSAGKPSATPVDAELARELAYRSAVRTVLEGRVGRLGKGYSMTLRVVDADSARVLLSLSDAATDEESLIPTVGRITRKLRTQLGEHQGALQPTDNWLPSMTTSFEAFRALKKGRDLVFAGESAAAIPWCRRALALDPDYATAWGVMGYAFNNLNEADSSLAAFHQARARLDRLSERARLFNEIAISLFTESIDATLALSEGQVQLDPQNPAAHINRSYYFGLAGRHEEALECTRKAEEVSPFGPNQQVFGNRYWALLALGRVDEARLVLPNLRGTLAAQAHIEVAAAAGQWSAAESLAVALRNSASANDDLRRFAAAILAASQASRGQAKAADQTLGQVQLATEPSRRTRSAKETQWDRLRLSLFSRGVARAPEDPGGWDTTTAGLAIHGAWAAAAGDSTLARRLLAALRQRSEPDIGRQGFLGPMVVEGWMAARAGRWQDVIQVLGPAALQGEARGYVVGQSAPLVRWLVAEAYDHLGRPDSAAAYFERAIAAPPEGGTSFAQKRMASSFAHRRLVLLYARMNRLEEARRHWEIFSRTFTKPDPEMRPLVEEARVALARAEAMAMR